MANAKRSDSGKSGLESSAVSVLSKAVEFDQRKQFPSALVYYQEGIQLLMDVLQGTRDKAKRDHLREKAVSYMDRAEKVKEFIQKEKELGTYHEQIQIANDSTGNSYEKVFSRFLDEWVTSVEIEDPYIRSNHQIYNFLRFCELLVKKCPNLKLVNLTTGHDEHDRNTQVKKLQQIASSLNERNVSLNVTYSSTLHDREIRLDNGWIMKIGRGLDYFKATANSFSIGFCDHDLRRCYETTIDIFHSKAVKKS